MNMSSTKNGKRLLRHAIILMAKKRTADAVRGNSAMSLFNRKETLVFKTEQQRDAYIERLDAAHVDYDVATIGENIYSRDKEYVIRVTASDLKKVS